MDKFKENIDSVTTRVLEDWGMFLVEPAETSLDNFDSEAEFLITTVQFQGVLTGTYAILCQQPFLEILSENLIGDEEEIEEEDKKDALKEMANVLCGNLVTECYGEDMVFDLVLPSVNIASEEQVASAINTRTICYLADDEPLLVTFLE